jgi:hypothetical protein
MKAGDTFKFSPRVQDKGHLWMVISDPESYPTEPVVIVNFTTHKPGRDPACVLDVGDHPFIVHKTSVYYAGARFAPNGRLDHLVECGDVIPDKPLTQETLARIRDGARDSEFIKEGVRKKLANQGLID